jgi:rod shape-determining protein MreC
VLAPRPRRRARAAVVAVALVLVVVVIVEGGVVSGLRSVGRAVVAPFAYVLNGIAHPIADAFGGVVNYSSVLQQNRELREELATQSQDSNEDATLTEQLQALTSVEHLAFVKSESLVVAQVTANSPTNFAATFTINKGSSSGVLAGMPVVGAGGLLGRVVSTSSSGATVMLITDPTSIVGATFGNGTDDTLIFGRGVNSPLAVTDVPLAAPLVPGTLLTTDGLRGGIFPLGIPVARVATVTYTPGSSDYSMTLAPTADFHDLFYVDVLLWEPST